MKKKNNNNLSKLSIILLVLFTMILFIAQNIKVPDVPSVRKNQEDKGFSAQEMEKYSQIKLEAQQKTQQTLQKHIKDLDLPYKGRNFSIEEVTDPTILYIHIDKKEPSQAKIDAINWLKSQGITNADKLNIMWIEE